MTAFVLSCEHGGNRVPRAYRHLFAGAEPALRSHLGWDPGALALAERLARALAAPLQRSTVTRLLVDLNRSLGHPRHLSEYTRALSPQERSRLIASHYTPFRRRFAERVESAVGGGRIVHLSVHSFTPELDGIVREIDLGLLYDPRRPSERAFCAAWARSLRAALPELRIRRNAPYRGAADGHTTALRRRFADPRYLGIEIELNQALASTRELPRIARALARTAVEVACLSSVGVDCQVAARCRARS
jgi:predicted N-formylglutamate amidohydrolase